jgi:hypothetical protein
VQREGDDARCGKCGPVFHRKFSVFADEAREAEGLAPPAFRPIRGRPLWLLKTLSDAVRTGFVDRTRSEVAGQP